MGTRKGSATRKNSASSGISLGLRSQWRACRTPRISHDALISAEVRQRQSILRVAPRPTRSYSMDRVASEDVREGVIISKKESNPNEVYRQVKPKVVCNTEL